MKLRSAVGAVEVPVEVEPVYAPAVPVYVSVFVVVVVPPEPAVNVQDKILFGRGPVEPLVEVVPPDIMSVPSRVMVTLEESTMRVLFEASPLTVAPLVFVIFTKNVICFLFRKIKENP